MKPIGIIRIDAHTQEICHETQCPSLDNLQSILKAETIQAVRLYSYPSVYMLVDENARVWCNEEKLYFKLDDWVLVNRCILVGVNGHGDWSSVELQLDDIKPRVTFLPIDYVDEPITMQVVSFPNVS